MRALVLSGGGSRGQYHIGALQYLIGELGLSYQIYCGVSVGALITAHMAQYPAGQERAGALEAKRLFDSVRNKDIYKKWKPFGVLHGMPWPFGWHKSSFYNSAPLEAWVDEHIDGKLIRSSGKHLRFGAVDFHSGEFKMFTEEDVPLERAVMASAAFPGMFAPVQMMGKQWIDGGVRTVTPIKAAIDAGAKRIDIIMCNPESVATGEGQNPSGFGVLGRAIEIMHDQVIDDDLEKALLYNELCEHRREVERIQFKVVRPYSQLNGSSLEFDPKEAAVMQARGYKDAKAIIKE